MARKVAVQGESTHLKKSVAALLVRRLVAVWVVQNVMIRRVAVKDLPRELPKAERGDVPYIPERLPPVDLPGLHFEEPQSEQWKRQHRNVVL